MCPLGGFRVFDLVIISRENSLSIQFIVYVSPRCSIRQIIYPSVEGKIQVSRNLIFFTVVKFVQRKANGKQTESANSVENAYVFRHDSVVASVTSKIHSFAFHISFLLLF